MERNDIIMTSIKLEQLKEEFEKIIKDTTNSLVMVSIFGTAMRLKASDDRIDCVYKPGLFKDIPEIPGEMVKIIFSTPKGENVSVRSKELKDGRESFAVEMMDNLDVCYSNTLYR